MDKVIQVKKKLHLEEICDDIDSDLLIKALTHKSGIDTLDIDLKNRIIIKYGNVDYNDLDFIGDAALHMIHVNLVTQKIESAKMSTIYIQALISNKKFYQYMVEKDIYTCVIKQPNTTVAWKVYADVFEAIIGAIYHHLFYVKKLNYQALTYMEDWLCDQFAIEKEIKTLIQMNEYTSNK